MANNAKDFYKILSVPQNATEKELKQAYRRLARQYHPDVNPDKKNAEEKFKEVSEAYQVLSNPEKRKLYDNYGHLWDQAVQNRGGSPTNTNDFGFGSPFGSFQEIFETFSGNQGRVTPDGRTRPDRSPRRGPDVHQELKLTLEEVIEGVTRPLTVEFTDRCTACDGAGGMLEPCSNCNGAGVSSSGQGLFNLNSTCRRCKGNGKTIGMACTTCRRSGSTQTSRRVEIRVPPGIAEGSKLRLARQGSRGKNGGDNGDLFLVIRIQTHPFFKRQGDHLSCTVPITFAEATLGAEIDVPTKTGKITMQVPAGTQGGQTFRLSGLGMPRSSGFGDFLVQVNIVTPKNLTEREQQLINELRDIHPEDCREGLTDFRTDS